MKKGVILVNVARGPLVNNDDLIEGIKNRQIGGFAADVLDGEGNIYFLFLELNSTTFLSVDTH